MALKQGVFQKYIKERRIVKDSLAQKIPEQNSTYSHYKVFDDPEIDKVHSSINDITNASDTTHLGDSANNEGKMDVDVSTHETLFNTNNQKQTVNKPITKPQTKGKQSVSASRINAEPKHKTVNKPTSEPLSFGKQTDNKQTDLHRLPKLTGLQRNLIVILYKSAKLSGGHITQEITLEFLSAHVQKPKETIKTTLYRLRQKNCLTTKDYKDGRGGWVKYEINSQLHSDLLQHENMYGEFNFGKQTVNHRYTEPMTQPITLPDSSSNNIKITTTEPPKLPEEWLNINIAPLADIGFSRKHLYDIYASKQISSEVAEESINHFSFGLQNHPDKYKKYPDPVNVFIGTLRKGNPWIESSYRSPKEIALEKMLEVKKTEKARIEAMENELLSVEFDIWREKLSSAEINKLVPTNIRQIPTAVEATLKNYFRDNIWKAHKEKLQLEPNGIAV